MAPAKLIVIGASAGGIDALSRLMSRLPADLLAPIVIAQHLDPRRPSHLADILNRQGSLPVRIADNGTPLEDGFTYVAPPDRNIRIEGRTIALAPADPGAIAPSVDVLLTSAAEAWGPDVLAVILSGSGSDGAAGATAVKRAGGTVLVENPATAAFASMPAAVAPDVVDEIADIDDMADAIASRVLAIPPGLESDTAELDAFFEGLRERTGIEFRAYKQPTIRRRLHSRMEATGQPTVGAYLAHLEGNVAEQKRLFGHLLIKVTEFFRDRALFEYLAETVFPDLIRTAAREHREVRVWSAGCATGEEGYSLGISMREAIDAAGANVAARIFATDIDPDAIAVARRGRYTAASLRNVPKQLVSAYFNPVGRGFEVTKALRSMLVFGEHDLGQRAPFPHIDLIVCQNVLIYFTQPLQRIALETFAFSLRPGGRLALGASETAGALPEPFVEEATKPRIYRRTESIARIPLSASAPAPAIPGRRPRASALRPRAVPAPVRGSGSRDPETALAADQLLLDLSVGLIVVDQQYAISRINPAARRLLGVHGTATGQDFIHLAEVFPSSSLRTLIDAALAGKAAAGTFEIEPPDDTEEETRFISVRARPRRAAGPTGARRPPAQGAVIELIDVSEGERESRLRARSEQRLEKSRATVRRLRRANEELTELADELRFLNDGLQLAGEDAQTGREELETLNEEFQATNEELEAVNEELTASVEELRSTNEQLALRTGELREQALELEAGKRDSDEDRARLQSVLASLGDAVVAVDHQGATVATNPAYDRLLQAAGPDFTPRDVSGTPIPAAEWPQSRAARGDSFQMEFAIWTPLGAHQWYEAVAEPLVLPDRTWGGVVTIRDISERTMRISLERLMAAASHELRTPLAALHGYLQLVERHLQDVGPSTVSGYATQALGQARQMGVLLDLLFDVSRVRSGQLTLDRREVDLVAVAERAIATVSAVAGSPPVELGAPRERVMVLGDATRLEQVFVNLIGNAVEHARSPRVEVTIRKVRNRAEAEIRDFGIGMDLAGIPDLFEPYRSFPADARRPAAGLGLGLFLSREIMLAHGGTIAIRSERAAGTTVEIGLPLLAPDGRAAGGPEAASSGGRSEPAPARAPRPRAKRTPPRP